jgi:ABC-type Zn uptake system ZnuABC Zn-binding protein ZnuA
MPAGTSRPAATAALALAWAVLVAACSPLASPPATPRALSVVATTTVLTDLVARVGGGRVEVGSLVPRGGEVHTFDLSPSTAARVAGADLLVMNGLGLDDWLMDLVAASGTDAPVVALGQDLPGVELIADEVTGAANPHLWLDVGYAQRYVERIGEALSALDPAGASEYAARVEAYVAELGELDGWARDTMAAIPASQRRIVGFHDALPYFARAYGLEVVAVVVPAPGQDPSAGAVAALIDAIRRQGVRAIISEVQFSPALAETIARETGADVVADLYTDTLGDPPLDSYAAVIRWDVERIAGALR